MHRFGCRRNVDYTARSYGTQGLGSSREAVWPLRIAAGRLSVSVSCHAAASSLSYLLIFTFNAYAMYLFAVDQTRSRAGAFVAGVIFGFTPITLSDGGHVNMLITGWAPLALISVDRVITAPGWRHAALGGLLFAMLGITRWQLLAIAMVPAAAFLFQRLYTRRATISMRTWG
jgi:hypothetical protein